jgi:hypothetical protein
MRIHRVFVGGLAVAAAVGLYATPSDAGAVRIQSFVAKDKTGPFSSESVMAQLGSGKSKSFYIKVTSTALKGTVPVSMTALSDNEEGYKQKWFRKDNNITPEVKGGGFDFNLTPGQAKKFRLLLKADNSPEDFFCSVTQLEDTGLSQSDNVFVRINGSGACVA